MSTKTARVFTAQAVINAYIGCVEEILRHRHEAGFATTSSVVATERRIAARLLEILGNSTLSNNSITYFRRRLEKVASTPNQLQDPHATPPKTDEVILLGREFIANRKK